MTEQAMQIQVFLRSTRQPDFRGDRSWTEWRDPCAHLGYESFLARQASGLREPAHKAEACQLALGPHIAALLIAVSEPPQLLPLFGLVRGNNLPVG